MRVLIINTNREHTPHVIIPFGACCAASAAKTAGHEVRFIDLSFAHSPEKAVEREVQILQPDLIGFSIRNIDNCDFASPIFYLPEIKRLVQACRKHSKAPVVIGGPAVSILPDEVSGYVGADYAVTGDGETAFPELLSKLAIETSPPTPAIRQGEGEKFCSPIPATGRGLAKHCDFSYPDLRDWLDIKRYLSYGAPAPVQTKRGCPFHCSYCLYPVIEGNTLRLRPPDMVVSDIEHVKRIGFKSIDFVDSVFNVPMEHAVACCEAIAEADLKLPLQTVGFNPAQCSPELVEAMNRAGFTAVGCTAESASDRMLASLNKGFGSEKLRETAHALRKLNAVRLWLFMLGGPGETEQTVKETADFMRDSLSTKDLVYVGCGIRILPGAELHSTAVEEQIIREGDDLIEPQFNFFASSYARKSNVNNIRVRLPEVKHHKCSREQPEITAADADTGPQDGHYSSILAVRTFVEQASQSSSVCSKWLLEMLLTRHRKEIEELLDRPENTLREVERSLSDLEWTNRWFRGRNALFSHLLSLLEQAGSFLDVACGSGDMVRALSDRCKSMRISPLIVGADINPTVLTVARKRSASYSDIDFIEADALALPFADRSFDVVFSSTFLHQLNPDKAVTALKEASRVAGKHLIISDLVRHDLALVGVWLIGWFLFERISRYDGVTSVKRAYTHREMLELADKAELFGSRVYNHPFFRMALVYDKSDR